MKYIVNTIEQSVWNPGKISGAHMQMNPNLGAFSDVLQGLCRQYVKTS